MGLFDKDILDRLETKFSRTVNSAGGKASNFLYSTFVAPVEDKIKQMEQKIHKLLGIKPLKAKPEEVRATLADLHRSMFYMNTAYQPSKSKDEVSNDKFSDLRKKFDTAAKHLETNDTKSQNSFGEYCVAAWQFEVDRHSRNAEHAEKMAAANPQYAKEWRQYAEFSKANAEAAGKHLQANKKMLDRANPLLNEASAKVNPIQSSDTYETITQTPEAKNKLEDENPIYEKIPLSSRQSSAYKEKSHYAELSYPKQEQHEQTRQKNDGTTVYAELDLAPNPNAIYSTVNISKQNNGTAQTSESRPSSVIFNVPPPPADPHPDDLPPPLPPRNPQAKDKSVLTTVAEKKKLFEQPTPAEPKAQAPKPQVDIGAKVSVADTAKLLQEKLSKGNNATATPESETQTKATLPTKKQNSAKAKRGIS
ncbi:MAG: hypothetical protein RLZZ59_258 [Pseudomonadota bacterium]|jgi:hypothetical protein